MYYPVVVLIEIVTVVNMDKEREPYVVVEKKHHSSLPTSLRPSERKIIAIPGVCC